MRADRPLAGPARAARDGAGRGTSLARPAAATLCSAVLRPVRDRCPTHPRRALPQRGRHHGAIAHRRRLPAGVAFRAPGPGRGACGARLRALVRGDGGGGGCGRRPQQRHAGRVAGRPARRRRAGLPWAAGVRQWLAAAVGLEFTVVAQPEVSDRAGGCLHLPARGAAGLGDRAAPALARGVRRLPRLHRAGLAHPGRPRGLPAAGRAGAAAAARRQHRCQPADRRDRGPPAGAGPLAPAAGMGQLRPGRGRRQGAGGRPRGTGPARPARPARRAGRCGGSRPAG